MSSTPISLGARLAQNDELRLRAKTDADAARRLPLTVQERQQFELVELFFRQVKESLSQAILEGKDSRCVYAQVGGSRHGSPLYRASTEMARALEPYRYDLAGMHSLKPTGRFGSLWVEFQNWASSQGLAAAWQFEHDGMGMDSWFVLRLQPAVAA